MVTTISEKKNCCRRDPEFGTKNTQSLGKNRVVLNASAMLSKHLSRVFYIGLIPSDQSATNSLTGGSTTSADEFVKQVSYISWEQLHNYCLSLGNTGEFPLALASFSYNGEQIYIKKSAL
jgi:hypothetical protein